RPRGRAPRPPGGAAGALLADPPPPVGGGGAVVAGLVLGAGEPQFVPPGAGQLGQPLGDLPGDAAAHRPAGCAPRKSASRPASPFAAAWISSNARAYSPGWPP